MKKNIFISILHFNNTEATLACLESLRECIIKDTRVTVLIIDNASKEPFILPKNAPEKWQIIRNEKNLGFTGGHNIGMRHALAQQADYVLVLNNDTTVAKEFLQYLLQASEEDPRRGVIAPKIYYSPGSEYHKDRYSKSNKGKVIWYAGGSIDWQNVSGKHRGVDEVDSGLYDTAESVSFISGCCMLLKREVIEKVGLFDDRYFLYYEDADLCERAKAAGFLLWYEPKSVIWHKNAEASGGSGSQLQEYYIARNRMLFGMSYGSIRVKIALFRESFRFMFKGRTWQKKGTVDFYKRKFGKGTYSIHV